MWTYLFYRSNCVFQIVYVGLIVGGGYLVPTYLMPNLPNQFLNKYHSIGISACLLFSFGLFLVLSIKNPGIITVENIHLFKKYPHHSELFPLDATCRTCKFARIPRSKHCSICDKCHARADHHCIWFNQCIAVNNYGYFLLFLFTQFFTCGYGAYLISGIFMHQYHLMKTQPTDDMADILYLIMLRPENRPLLVFLTISSVMWVLLGLFIGYQLRRVAANSTTNEEIKRTKCLEQLSEMTDDEIDVTRASRLDLSFGGVFDAPKALTNEEIKEKRKEMTRRIEFNPYRQPSLYQNFMDAILPAQHNIESRKTL